MKPNAPFPSPSINVTPEWVGLPRSGSRCPYTNLSRSGLNNLILGPCPPVHSVVVKSHKSAKRGRRLVYYPSLSAYLASLADTSPGPSEKGAETSD